MGLFFSKKYANIYSEPKIRKWQTRFNQLKLSEKEVGQLYEVYERVVPPDALRQAVLLKPLVVLCKLDGKPLATRMLAAFAKGQPFVGFVFALWHVCTTDERDLADYVFGLYNVQSDGSISAESAQTMLLELYGEAFKEGGRRRGELMLQLYGHSSDPKPLTRKEFKSFCRRQSATLFMAFNVQKKIAEAVVGKPFWEAQSRKRERIPDGEMVLVAKLRADILSGRLLDDEDNDEDATGGDGDDDDDDGEDPGAARARASAAAAVAAAAAAKTSAVKAKSQKVIPLAEAPPGTIKASSSGGGAGGGGVGAVGTAKIKPKSRASFDAPLKNGANGNDDPQGFRRRSPSLESAPMPDKVTYLTEVRGVTSEAALKQAKKAMAEAKDDKKGGRKKLVESNKLDKHALKAVLKATMHIDEDDDDEAKKPAEAAGDGAAATAVSLKSGTKGGAAAAADEKDKGGLLSMFSRVEKKKALKKKKMPAEPPPTSILLTDEKKKRKPSDKRVVFDIPEGEDEDFGYDIEDNGD